VIKLMRGRYGPYVTDGETNATVPNGTDPLSVTLEQATTLIDERVAKGGGKKPKKKAPAKAKAKPVSAKANGKQPVTKAQAKKPAAKPKGKPVAAESE
jgi:DNA topoisomerase-1